VVVNSCRSTMCKANSTCDLDRFFQGMQLEPDDPNPLQRVVLKYPKNSHAGETGKRKVLAIIEAEKGFTLNCPRKLHVKFRSRHKDYSCATSLRKNNRSISTGKCPILTQSRRLFSYPTLSSRPLMVPLV
jgi:hypothetical protein